MFPLCLPVNLVVLSCLGHRELDQVWLLAGHSAIRHRLLAFLANSSWFRW